MNWVELVWYGVNVGDGFYVLFMIFVVVIMLFCEVFMLVCCYKLLIIWYILRFLFLIFVCFGWRMEIEFMFWLRMLVFKWWDG